MSKFGALRSLTSRRRKYGTRLSAAVLAPSFNSEISNVVARLTDNPLIYTAVYRDIRRAVVHRFPYLIWYRVLGDKVTVLACTHSRLNPATAINRLHE